SSSSSSSSACCFLGTASREPHTTTGNSSPLDWWMVRNETHPLGAYSASSSYSPIPPSYRKRRNWLNRSRRFFSRKSGLSTLTKCRYSNLVSSLEKVPRLRAARPLSTPCTASSVRKRENSGNWSSW